MMQGVFSDIYYLVDEVGPTSEVRVCRACDSPVGVSPIGRTIHCSAIVSRASRSGLILTAVCIEQREERSRPVNDGATTHHSGLRDDGLAGQRIGCRHSSKL